MRYFVNRTFKKMAKPSNVKALETGSCITWDEWLAYLSTMNAKEMSHHEIASKVLEKIVEKGKSKSPEWWSHGVALAYEKHIGKRKERQTCDGSFSVTVSKTVDGDMNFALNTWQKRVKGVSDFNGVKIQSQPSVSETEKWRYWRCRLEDKSEISVNIRNKPNGVKSTLAINHDNLQDEDAPEKWRDFWKSFEV